MSTNNHHSFMSLLIFEKKLSLTSKKFKKKIRNALRLFFGLTQIELSPFLFGLLLMGLSLGLFQYRIRPNFNLGANNIAMYY